MIGAVIQKELVTLSRSSVFLWLSCAMLALVIAAAALSGQRLATFERERHTAEAIDQEVWEGQGARNPHSAAHFSRYAFKPIPSLAAFDPGVIDYAGIAVWMEAHVQNPAVFRRAEDLGDDGQFANLSPAWVLQVIAPLFLFLILFGTVSGEREDGTLRQLAASGAPPRALFAGKLVGTCAAIGVITLPALLLGVWAVSAASDDAMMADTGIRTLGLILTYALYFAGLGGFALGISALCRDRRSALITLVSLWAVSIILLPRLASGLAMTLYPQPDASDMANALKAIPMAYRKDTAYQEKMKAELLAQYGAQRVEDLPVDFLGYRLQKGEEYTDPLFDAFYDDIHARHAQQARLLDALSIVSPVLAVQSLSAGLSGSDRVHQIDFTKAAEAHRRKIIKQLNDELLINGVKTKGRYIADPSLWKDVPNLRYSAPDFATLAGRYTGSFTILLLFAAVGVSFAMAMLGRAHRRIAA